MLNEPIAEPKTKADEGDHENQASCGSGGIPAEVCRGFCGSPDFMRTSSLEGCGSRRAHASHFRQGQDRPGIAPGRNTCEQSAGTATAWFVAFATGSNDIRNELLKIISQKKNYIAVAGHLLLMGLCIYGISKSENLYRLAKIGKMGIELADFKSFLDGFFFARMMIIPSFVIIMPILVCTVGGDLIAGEIQDGSLRLYASRPRGRTGIIFSKIAAMFLFCFAYCIYFGLAGLAAGYFFFGWQNTQIIPLLDLGMGTDMEITSSSACLVKYALLVTYYSFSTMALGCITLFFSSLFNRMTSATVAGITLYFVSYIFESLPLLVSLRPYLLSHAMNASALFWLDPIPVFRVSFNMLILLSYILIFSSATLMIFKNKDI